jgi:hypothetical protein
MSRADGEKCLKYYFGVRILRNKKRRKIMFSADRIRIENGDLLLIEERNGREEVFRAFARGTWFDVYAASCMDGTEVYEDHDVDEETGKDLR